MKGITFNIFLYACSDCSIRGFNRMLCQLYKSSSIRGVLKSCGWGGECKVGAEATWERGGPMMAMAMDVMNIVADAQSYELDTSGSTIPYPSRGDFVVTLSNSATGAVQASRVFSWVKVGTLLKAQDPNAINDWAYANSSSADKITYDVVRFRSNYAAGPQVIAGQSKYEGSTQATYSVAFDGTSCPRVPTPTPCNNN
ncbi:hypothetical protein [Xanthomonas maliensis]|uniref:hypothetical protein n=1 Tax=Xanthomonas maliensis TaxID=1321368 RepID=UPI0012641C91|nr:hypothetical protein [Xanthomonas maliensis]